MHIVLRNTLHLAALFCSLAISDELHSPHNIRAALATKDVFLSIEHESLYKNPSFWKVKLGLFHLMMIPKYLIHHLIMSGIATLIQVVTLTLNSDLIITQTGLYWAHILGTIIMHMFVAATLIRTPPDITFALTRSDIGGNRRQCKLYHLPQRLMVLSSIMLRQQFIGEMNKRGCQWAPIFRSLHRTGTNGVTNFAQLRKININALYNSWTNFLHWLGAAVVVTVSTYFKGKRLLLCYASSRYPKIVKLASIAVLLPVRSATSNVTDPCSIQKQAIANISKSTLDLSSSVLKSTSLIATHLPESKHNVFKHICSSWTDTSIPVLEPNATSIIHGRAGANTFNTPIPQIGILFQCTQHPRNDLVASISWLYATFNLRIISVHGAQWRRRFHLSRTLAVQAIR